MTRPKPWYDLFLRFGGLLPAIALALGAGYLISAMDHAPRTNIVIALLWTGVAAVLVGLSGYRAFRAIVVRDFGQARRAQVTGIVRIGPSAMKTALFGARGAGLERAWIIWRDEAGDIGQSLTQSAAFAYSLPVGLQITVFVDPRRTRVSFWEGDVGMRP
jgi:hypothetical protein